MIYDYDLAVSSGSAPPEESSGSRPRRASLRNPLSIVLIAVTVIGLVAACLIAGELYLRERVERIVEAAAECTLQDTATVSIGATPVLLQLATGRYRSISIHTAGNQLRDVTGMKADLRLDDVRLTGGAHGTGTIGALDATVTWSADGMKQTVREAIPLVGGLVTGVQTNPDDATVQLQGTLGGVTIEPQVARGVLALTVVDVNGLGLLTPPDVVQSKLDEFTTNFTESYPIDLRADGVQVTDNGVTLHYSAREASMPAGDRGAQGDEDDPRACLADL